MKALILSAGLGTRLKPWTLTHPKALVPVAGIPMLERVIRKLEREGVTEIVVNIHHFGDQIIDFLKSKDFDANIQISDETDTLLDTGGGIVKASSLLMKKDNTPFIVHNVDILSNVDLKKVMDYHHKKGNDITLVVSRRESTRKLIFTAERILLGWHNLKEDIYKPSGIITKENADTAVEMAFSGIYIINDRAIKKLKEYSEEMGVKVFPIMDFFLSNPSEIKIGGYWEEGKNIDLIDIGKPATLWQAQQLSWIDE